jgi:hypothetical protein
MFFWRMNRSRLIFAAGGITAMFHASGSAHSTSVDGSMAETLQAECDGCHRNHHRSVIQIGSAPRIVERAAPTLEGP